MDYLLILRGINGGSYHQIKMATLRALLTAGGLVNVTSYANSGNLCFTSDQSQPACEQQIATILGTNFDFPINFGVFTKTTFLTELKQAPAWWGSPDNRQHMCLFKLKNYAEHDGWLRDHLTPIDQVATTPHLIFWSVVASGNFQHSWYGQVWGTAFYAQTSTRSYRTTRRLWQLLQERTT
ncbi:DUF1697 domain-containing protein [Levilactobacillus fuyuanensis]|uniref:DUF1697 domain-containing protein n=1 Tax=Levilactobacillus fuyuanensis TaxID=2486022 RepID=A0ABW4H3T9_9LACO|nr:DUF1697 domain-containing protein [Levilactobacillus fuyuanensis]